ncbi:MAG: TadE/TadG family type IV pilus assembly protein [Rhizobiaceae bacterium]
MRAFLSDRSGNYAMMTSVLVLPLLAAAGLSVDYYTLTQDQKVLQNAADSAVLAVAAAGDANGKALAERYLVSNFGGKILSVDLDQDGGEVTLKVRAQSKLAFFGLFGSGSKPVSVKSSASTAALDYEVGLVLDTTGSMAGGKLDALKDAATTLVTDMTNDYKGGGKLKFALVPFSGFVNVGPQFGPAFNSLGMQTKAAAKWLDAYGQNPIPQGDLDKNVSRFALYQKLGQTWSGCVEARGTHAHGDYAVEDVEPDAKQPETLFVPAFNPDEPDDPGLFPNSYLADGVAGLGQGTFEQRMQRYGAPAIAERPTTLIGWIIYILSWKKVTPDTTPSTYYSDYNQPKGPGFQCDSQALTPLTTDTALVKKNIAALSARGSTNTAEGVAWGWRVLSSREPFTEGAKEDKANTEKIMVVLTDGTNFFGTRPNPLGSQYTAYGYLADERIGPDTLNASGTTSAMDDKTLSTCTNAKKDGIEIFTVLLEVNDEATSSMLEQCASDPEHFFNVKSRSKLKEVFQGIVKKAGRVRLSG